MQVNTNKEVITFMEEELDGSIHPALNSGKDSGVSFDGNWKAVVPHQSWIPSSTPSDALKIIYADCDAAQATLCSSIEKCQTSLGYPVVKLHTVHTWLDVEKALVCPPSVFLDSTKESSLKKVKGLLSRIRSSFDKACENAVNAKSFADLVPTDSYLSVLCGGLKLVCTAAMRIDTIRRHITNFLEQIECLVRDSQGFLELHKHDIELHRRNAALSASILKALEAIVQWTQKSAAKKALSALARPGNYEQNTVDRIDEVKKLRAAFKEQVEICHQRAVANIGKDTQYLCQQTTRNAIIQQSIYEQSMTHAQLMEKAVQTMNTVMELLCSDPSDTSNSLLRGMKQNLLSYGIDSPALRAEHLLEGLEYDATSIMRDSEMLQKLRFTLRETDQDRAVALIRDRIFRDFTTALESSALLVHGKGTRTMKSPVSFVSARLLESLRTIASMEAHVRFIPLAFFCGLHVNDGHPAELMLQLLLQLIESQQEHIDSGPLQEGLGHFDPNKEASVFEVFAGVVKQLAPNTVVSIIVDSVSYYEDPGRREGILQMVHQLLGLCLVQGGPIVKILMTSPSGTLMVGKLFREFETETGKGGVLEMRKAYKSQGGFRALSWKGFSEQLETIAMTYAEGSE